MVSGRCYDILFIVKVKILAFRAIDRFEVCVDLTFDLKVISAILSLHINQHIICN